MIPDCLDLGFQCGHRPPPYGPGHSGSERGGPAGGPGRCV